MIQRKEAEMAALTTSVTGEGEREGHRHRRRDRRQLRQRAQFAELVGQAEHIGGDDHRRSRPHGVRADGDAGGDECGREATKNSRPHQPGDVPATRADASLLKTLTGYAPQTPFREGVARFVAWYREYYGV